MLVILVSYVLELIVTYHLLVIPSLLMLISLLTYTQYDAEEESLLAVFKALETNLRLESFHLYVSEFPEDLSVKVRTYFAANYSLLDICLFESSTEEFGDYFTDITWRNTLLKNERRFKTAKLPPSERPEEEEEEHRRKKQKVAE